MAHTKFQKQLAQKIYTHRKIIWNWFCENARAAPPPFYCSIDLRDAGFKIGPVDSNLFPAGFNNICPEDVRASTKPLRNEIEKTALRLGRDSPKSILILPEAHTSNKFYIENLFTLNQLLESAGFKVRVGWVGPTPETPGPVKLESASQKVVEAFPISVSDGFLRAGDFTPDLIVLNNDFSGGYPPILDQIEQPVVPSHRLGWHKRTKSEHFRHYNELVDEFCKIIEIDPWLLRVETSPVDDVNFNEEQGLDRVADTVRNLLQKVEGHYKANKIDRNPFVFVKNNSGTYGIGVMVVHSVEEIESMNRRTKNKMSIGKNKSAIHSVVVQEGVPTATLVDRLPAEPVIYVCGLELIGGFLRTNTERGDEDNLNSQGMVFRKLCMSDLTHPEDDDPEDETGKKEPVLELVYGTIARISALATGRELKALE